MLTNSCPAPDFSYEVCASRKPPDGFCPINGILCFIIIGWFSVLLLFLFTCYKAYEVVCKRERYNDAQEINEDALDGKRSELSETYSSIPEEYLTQTYVYPPSLPQSFNDSNEDQDAIDTMLETLVNSSTSNTMSERRRKTSMHLLDAVSAFQGESVRNSSNSSLPRRGSTFTQARRFSRRSASIFEDSGYHDSNGSSFSSSDEDE